MTAKPLYLEYNEVPNRKSFMTRRSELPAQQLRELRVGHLNPGSDAEQFTISPPKGRGPHQPLTRQELIDYVNDDTLPARLHEWERQSKGGREYLPVIPIPASIDGLHDA